MARTRTSFKKGQPKTGGRRQGVPNKRTLEARAVFEEHDYDPLQSLIARRQKAEEDEDWELCTKLDLELLPYRWPRRKAVEHSGETSGPVTFVMTLAGDQ